MGMRYSLRRPDLRTLGSFSMPISLEFIAHPPNSSFGINFAVHWATWRNNPKFRELRIGEFNRAADEGTMARNQGKKPKKTRGTQKVRKATKQQRRKRLSKSGNPKRKATSRAPELSLREMFSDLVRFATPRHPIHWS